MRTSRTLTVVEVGLATLAPASTAVLYADYFAGTGYLPVVLGAAVAGTVVAAVASWRRLPGWGTAVLATCVLLILAAGAVFTPTLRYGLPTVETARQLGTGLLRGWARMLTVNLPADVTPALLITPTLVLFAATCAATLLSLRTRASLSPLVPALAAYAVALLLTGGRAAGGAPLAAAFALELLLLALVRVSRVDSPDPGRSTRSWRSGGLGRVAFGLPVVLLIAGLAAAGAYTVPVADGSDPFDPRSVVPIPLSIEDRLTPLATLKSQLREQPARKLFTVRVDGDAKALGLDRVRTAALDRFDGALWTSDDSFLVAGHTLPRNTAVQHPRQVVAQVQIDALDRPYLPTVGWPVKLATSGLGFSETSGVLVSPAASLEGLRYDVTCELRPGDDQLAVATLDDRDTARYTDLPKEGLPPDIVARAAQLTDRHSQPYAKLKALEEYLHALPYSLDARPGHSYDALKRLFSSSAQDRVGYAEQYASAFAILARSQGFPTRVAAGYLLRDSGRAGGAWTVTTADAHAWPEVAIAGYGWVPFEPTNFTRTKAVPPEEQEKAAEPSKEGDSEERGSKVTVDPNLPGGPTTRQRVIAGALITALVLGTLLLLIPMLTALEKARRRYRRRRGLPAARVVGAWHDVADRLVEHGQPVSRASTPIEVAAAAQDRHGEAASAVALLAPIVTAAVSSPHPPNEDLVREAWRLNGQIKRDLRRHRGVWRGARGWIDPRPLFSGWHDSRRRRRTMTRLRGGSR
jgi:transglutaminase-like putative cysteine protease